MKIEIQRALADTYSVLDAAVRKHIGNRPISCSKGCCHCCSLYLCTTIADGINIALHLVQWREWEKWIPRLASEAKEMTMPGINKITWWERNIPCVFLKNNLCSVYDYRPAECRYYFVCSPAEYCRNDNHSHKHASYDTYEAQGYIWRLSQTIHSEYRGLLGPFSPGPLPLMVLHGLRTILQKSRRKRIMIEKALEGIPTPVIWVQDQVKLIANRKQDILLNQRKELDMPTPL